MIGDAPALKRSRGMTATLRLVPWQTTPGGRPWLLGIRKPGNL